MYMYCLHTLRMNVEGARVPLFKRFFWAFAILFFVPVMNATVAKINDTTQISSISINVSFDALTGSIGAVNSKSKDIMIIEKVTDSYEIETELSTKVSTENEDRVESMFLENGLVLFKCTNSKLPGLTIEKKYELDQSGMTLFKNVRFINNGNHGFFIKHFTDVKAGDAFRSKAFYFQPQKGNPNAIVSANKVKSFIQLGGDQAERQRMMLMSPKVGVGIVHWRHKIDGRLCLPRVGNNFALYGGWTIDGWRFSTAAFYLKPGESRSVEYRVEINDGDILGHYMRYRNLDELEKSLFNYSVPQWVQQLDVFIDGMGVIMPDKASLETQKVMGKTEDWWAFLRNENLNLAIRSGLFRPHWGDIPTKGTYEVHSKNGDVSKIDLDVIYKTARRLRKEIPGVQMGQYNMFNFIDSSSQFYKDHPESLIYRKDGQPDYEGAEGRPRPGEVGHAPSYLRDFGAPGMIDIAAKTAADQLENLENGILYTDGGQTGISRLNWKLKQVTQPYVWNDAFNKIRDSIRQTNPDAVILLNADVFPCQEINYWEYYGWRRENYDWRHIAVSVPIAKIMAKPEAVILLHKWNNMWASKLKEGKAALSDYQYAGYLLAFGLVPMYDNLTLAMAKQRLPIVRAAKELRGSRMVNAKVNPAWWHHAEPIGVEAYTLNKGEFGLIPVMSRQEETKEENISFDIEPLNLSIKQGLYLWVNSYQAPPGDPIKSDQPYDRVFKVSSLQRNVIAPARAEVKLKLLGAGEALKKSTEPGPLQLVVASSVPAWVYSADGKRFQVALPEQDGITIHAGPSKTDELQLAANSEKDTAEVFLPFSLLGGRPKQIRIDYKEVPTSAGSWDEEAGVFLTVPKGNHIITLALK